MKLGIEREDVMVLNDSMQELSLEQTADVNGGATPAFAIISSEACLSAIVVSVTWVID